MSGSRRVVVHAGTHKTGTTSLQLSFHAARATLAGAGVLVPRAGGEAWPELGAHHGVATDLLWAGDGRPAVETRRLLDEMRTSPQPAVLLSSEIFSLLHAFPAELARFAAGLRDAGFAPLVVLYVRDRAAYAESLFAELIKHGSTWTIDEFVDGIERDGCVTHALLRGTYNFEYATLAERFESAFGAGNVRVRAYVPGRSNRDLLDDLAEVAALAPLASIEPIAARSNARLEFAETATRHAVNRGISDAVARVAAYEREPFYAAPFAAFENADAARIRARFVADDRALRERYGVELVEEPVGAPAPVPARVALRAIETP